MKKKHCQIWYSFNFKTNKVEKEEIYGDAINLYAGSANFFRTSKKAFDYGRRSTMSDIKFYQREIKKLEKKLFIKKYNYTFM